MVGRGCSLLLPSHYLRSLPPADLLSQAVLRTRLAIGAASDRRLNLIDKLLLGIQTVKSYLWEEPMICSIERSRKIEFRRLLRYYFCKGLVASAVFTALSLIDNLTKNIINLTYGMNSVADCYSVIKRTEEVLLLEEKEDQSTQQSQLPPPLRVDARKITASWLKHPEEPSSKDNLASVNEEEQLLGDDYYHSPRQ